MSLSSRLGRIFYRCMDRFCFSASLHMAYRPRYLILAWLDVMNTTRILDTSSNSLGLSDLSKWMITLITSNSKPYSVLFLLMDLELEIFFSTLPSTSSIMLSNPFYMGTLHNCSAL